MSRSEFLPSVLRDSVVLASPKKERKKQAKKEDDILAHICITTYVYLMSRLWWGGERTFHSQTNNDAEFQNESSIFLLVSKSSLLFWISAKLGCIRLRVLAIGVRLGRSVQSAVLFLVKQSTERCTRRGRMLLFWRRVSLFTWSLISWILFTRIRFLCLVSSLSIYSYLRPVSHREHTTGCVLFFDPSVCSWTCEDAYMCVW